MQKSLSVCLLAAAASAASGNYGTISGVGEATLDVTAVAMMGTLNATY